MGFSWLVVRKHHPSSQQHKAQQLEQIDCQIQTLKAHAWVPATIKDVRSDSQSPDDQAPANSSQNAVQRRGDFEEAQAGPGAPHLTAEDHHGADYEKVVGGQLNEVLGEVLEHIFTSKASAHPGVAPGTGHKVEGNDDGGYECKSDHALVACQLHGLDSVLLYQLPLEYRSQRVEKHRNEDQGQTKQEHTRVGGGCVFRGRKQDTAHLSCCDSNEGQSAACYFVLGEFLAKEEGREKGGGDDAAASGDVDDGAVDHVKGYVGQQHRKHVHAGRLPGQIKRHGWFMTRSIFL